MSRSDTLYEYAVEGDYRSPDCTTVAVTAELMEEAVDYYVENLSAHERSVMLSSYIYEDAYERIKNGQLNPQLNFMNDMVDDYIKDHD